VDHQCLVPLTKGFGDILLRQTRLLHHFHQPSGTLRTHEDVPKKFLPSFFQPEQRGPILCCESKFFGFNGKPPFHRSHAGPKRATTFGLTWSPELKNNGKDLKFESYRGERIEKKITAQRRVLASKILFLHMFVGTTQQILLCI
jgi:hypothetical protein